MANRRRRALPPATYSAEDVFVQALRFEAGCWALDDTIRTRGVLGTRVGLWPDTVIPALVVPDFVCEALCVELLLKTIYRLDSTTAPAIHELDELFADLPDPWKVGLRAEFLNLLADPVSRVVRGARACPTTLDACLAQSATAFARWRYAFELAPGEHFLGLARYACIGHLMARRPDWRPLVLQVRLNAVDYVTYKMKMDPRTPRVGAVETMAAVQPLR